jgi:hypothetical protein
MRVKAYTATPGNSFSRAAEMHHPTTDGTLKGDQVLIASGDPNLSNRVQADGTLAFENWHHSYGGPDSRGSCLGPVVCHARTRSANRVAGSQANRRTSAVRCLIVPQSEPEPGTGIVISPIVVNDNLVDVYVTAGMKENDPARVADSAMHPLCPDCQSCGDRQAWIDCGLSYQDETTNPDGSRSATRTGHIPAGTSACMPSPCLSRAVTPQPCSAKLSSNLEWSRRHQSTPPHPTLRLCRPTTPRRTWSLSTSLRL